MKEKAAHVWIRDPHDWYQEPTRATEGLLSVETFAGESYDPSCGAGNIVTTLREHGHIAWGTDLVQRVFPAPDWFDGRHDFLGDKPPPLAFNNIVMNPPFYRAKGAEAFIRKALALTPSKVAAFVDIKFLSGSGRALGLFSEAPPSRIWIITPRPSCPPGEFIAADNTAGGGTADWCWLVWDKTAPQDGTRFGWLKGRSARG